MARKCQTLTDIVVKFSGDPATFLLLRFYQLAAHAGESSIRQFAGGDVDKRDNGTHNFLPSPLRMTPVFSGETGSIGPPKHLVVNVYALPGARCPKYLTVLGWEWCAICTSPMDQMMHILAEKFVCSFIAQ